MQIPLQIAFRNMESSPAIEANVRERAAKLEHFSDRITSCHVVVEAPHRHHHKGKLYNVRVDITVPGEELATTHTAPLDHAHEDVYVAIRDAFNAAARRLEDHARRFRGAVKRHEPPLHGSVVRLVPEEGYGFIQTSDGNEVYFHKNSVIDGGFESLAVGSEVRLVLAYDESAEGPQASTVAPLGKHRHIVE